MFPLVVTLAPATGVLACEIARWIGDKAIQRGTIMRIIRRHELIEVAHLFEVRPANQAPRSPRRRHQMRQRFHQQAHVLGIAASEAALPAVPVLLGVAATAWPGPTPTTMS